MAPVAAALLCRRRRADRWRLRNGASPARRLCRWLEPGLLPETIGAMVWRRRCLERRGRPLSCVFVADAGSWAVLTAMWAAVTVVWVAIAA